MQSSKVCVFGFIPFIVLLEVPLSVNAENLKIHATKNTCRALIAHEPDDSVAFRPGVDVRGKPVVSANLPQEKSILDALSTSYEFSIRLNPLVGDSGNRFSETSLDLGKIRFDRETGAGSYNGTLIQGLGRRLIVQECDNILEPQR